MLVVEVGATAAVLMAMNCFLSVLLVCAILVDNETVKDSFVSADTMGLGGLPFGFAKKTFSRTGTLYVL
jgi:hypothetical protein